MIAQPDLNAKGRDESRPGTLKRVLRRFNDGEGKECFLWGWIWGRSAIILCWRWWREWTRACLGWVRLLRWIAVSVDDGIRDAYPEVMARVREILQGPKCWGRVIWLLTLRARIGRVIPGISGHVPKRELLTGLEDLLECEELRIAGKLREAAQMVKDFESMQVEARMNGRWPGRRNTTIWCYL